MAYASRLTAFKYPSLIDSTDYRVACLFAACVIYALFGSPTPDRLGVVEMSVGGLLLLSIGVGYLRDAVFGPVKTYFWEHAGQVFLIYGLSVPLLVAVMAGHDFGAVVRDFVPFVFLFLPLFLLPLIQAQPSHFRFLFPAVLLIGFIFALRSLLIRFEQGCVLWCGGDLLYLENMPTVLCVCLFLIGAAMWFLMRGFSMKNITIFSVLGVLSLVPMAAMAVTLQRASLGCVFLYVILIQGYLLYRYPARAFVVSLVGLVALFVFYMAFSPVFLALSQKTQQVGFNMRPQEFAAVWDVVSSDPLTFFFGIGWGGQFNSPAVGGLSVNFTHNFFSSILLKTGLLGVLCCMVYIAALLEQLFRVVLKNPVLGFALALPVLIDLTFYASFKSLDFGLMLLMISASLLYLRAS